MSLLNEFIDLRTMFILSIQDMFRFLLSCFFFGVCVYLCVFSCCLFGGCLVLFGHMLDRVGVLLLIFL